MSRAALQHVEIIWQWTPRLLGEWMEWIDTSGGSPLQLVQTEHPNALQMASQGRHLEALGLPAEGVRRVTKRV